MLGLKKILNGDNGGSLSFLKWCLVIAAFAWGCVSWVEIGFYIVFPGAPRTKPYVEGLVRELKCQVCGKVDVRDKIHDYMVQVKGGVAWLTCEDCRDRIEKQKAEYLKAVEMAKKRGILEKEKQVAPADLGMDFKRKERK